MSVLFWSVFIITTVAFLTITDGNSATKRVSRDKKQSNSSGALDFFFSSSKHFDNSYESSSYLGMDDSRSYGSSECDSSSYNGSNCDNNDVSNSN